VPAASAVHDAAEKSFDLTNLAFSKVLVLTFWHALEILDGAQAEDVMNTFCDLNLCIIRKETVWCPMLLNEVFKSIGHRASGICDSLFIPLAPTVCRRTAIM
jgi:hypothetical protein